MTLGKRLALAWRLICFTTAKQEASVALRRAAATVAAEAPGDPEHLFAQQVTEALLVMESQRHSFYSKSLLLARLNKGLLPLEVDREPRGQLQLDLARCAGL